jgi:hypothetical protein
MKKILLFTLALTAVTAVAQTPSSAPSQSLFRPSPPASSSSSIDVLSEEEYRFQSCENIGGSGFFWIDTTNGNLWWLDPAAMEWNFIGTPRGANTSRKGTYQLLSDRNGGVYVLNTDNGEGWWTDGTTWKIIGELSRRVKKED